MVAALMIGRACTQSDVAREVLARRMRDDRSRRPRRLRYAHRQRHNPIATIKVVGEKPGSRRIGTRCSCAPNATAVLKQNASVSQRNVGSRRASPSVTLGCLETAVSALRSVWPSGRKPMSWGRRRSRSACAGMVPTTRMTASDTRAARQPCASAVRRRGVGNYAREACR